jgi:hypothetical protein
LDELENTTRRFICPGQVQIVVVPRAIAFFRTANNPGLRQASSIAAMIPGIAGPLFLRLSAMSRVAE